MWRWNRIYFQERPTAKPSHGLCRGRQEGMEEGRFVCVVTRTGAPPSGRSVLGTAPPSPLLAGPMRMDKTRWRCSAPRQSRGLPLDFLSLRSRPRGTSRHLAGASPLNASVLAAVVRRRRSGVPSHPARRGGGALALNPKREVLVSEVLVWSDSGGGAENGPPRGGGPEFTASGGASGGVRVLGPEIRAFAPDRRPPRPRPACSSSGIHSVMVKGNLLPENGRIAPGPCAEFRGPGGGRGEFMGDLGRFPGDQPPPRPPRVAPGPRPLPLRNS